MHNLLGHKRAFTNYFFSHFFRVLHKKMIEFKHGGERMCILHPLWYNES